MFLLPSARHGTNAYYSLEKCRRPEEKPETLNWRYRPSTVQFESNDF